MPSSPPPVRCALLPDEVVDLAAGRLDPARAEAWEAHAASCGECSVELRRERRLQSLLAAMPDAPGVDLPVPTLPAAPVLRPALRWGWAAAVAAAVATVWALRLSPDDATNPDPHELGALRIVDVDDPSLAWDDGLLAMVAGAEAVASRRLADVR